MEKEKKLMTCLLFREHNPTRNYASNVIYLDSKVLMFAIEKIKENWIKSEKPSQDKVYGPYLSREFYLDPNNKENNGVVIYTYKRDPKSEDNHTINLRSHERKNLENLTKLLGLPFDDSKVHTLPSKIG